jgi:DNA replication licensing factor MCM7
MALDEDDAGESQNLPGELLLRDVRDRIIASGWVEDQLQECLTEYSDLGVIQVTGSRLVFL